MTNLYAMSREAYEDSKRWFPAKANDPFFQAACMAGEAGEVIDLLKKVERGTHVMDEKMQKRVAEEIADVFTYMINLCGVLGIDLQTEYDNKREYNATRFGA